MSLKKNTELQHKYTREMKLQGIGASRIIRVNAVLNHWTKRFFNNKIISKLSQEEVEDFFIDWKNGKFTKKQAIGFKSKQGKKIITNKPYSQNTIISNWKIFKKYYAWTLGHDKYSCPSWLKRLTISEENIEMPIDRGMKVTKKEVDLLAVHIRTIENRTRVYFLADHGCSYTEMMKLKLSNIEWDKDSTTLFINYPKAITKKRRASAQGFLYYESEFMQYLNEHSEWDSEKMKPKDPNAFVFPYESREKKQSTEQIGRYGLDSFNRLLKRQSNILFGVNWTSHWFRRGLLTDLEDAGMPSSLIETRTRHAPNSKAVQHYSARSKKKFLALKKLMTKANSEDTEAKYKSELQVLRDQMSNMQKSYNETLELIRSKDNRV